MQGRALINDAHKTAVHKAEALSVRQILATSSSRTCPSYKVTDHDDSFMLAMQIEPVPRLYSSSRFSVDSAWR